MREKNIKISFIDEGIYFIAKLMFEEEPEMCKILWKNLNKPVKYFCHHTLSTGQVFLGYPRPPRNRIKIGDQSVPIGRKIIKSTEMASGMIQYTGLFFRIAYGDNITEPVQCAGPVIARVKESSLDELRKSGQFVWRREALENKIITFIAERIEKEEN